MRRILLVHNRYQQRGGEDAVFEAERDLLLQSGHEVHTVEVSNDDIPEQPSVSQQVALAARTVWSRNGARTVSDAVHKHRAEVVHFHNTFPMISPAAYRAARRAGAATVQTLHNYRLVCPNALLFREGRPCHDCLGKSVAWPGVAHACYRDSRTQTLAVAAMQTTHRALRTWRTQVDRYVALTEFSRDRFIEGGLPSDQVDVKPNFVADPLTPAPDAERAGVGTSPALLFVGRLDETKGLTTLLRAWASDESLPPLRVAGDGPMRPEVEASASIYSTVTYLGRLTRPQVVTELGRATALIMPSHLYETFGLVAVEAFSTGTPVIASHLGAMAEVVEDGRTGLHFAPGDANDLAAKVRWAAAHPEELAALGLNARAEYEAKYTPERNLAMLLAIYERAIEHRRAAS